ncbi:MAG: DegT/DnrJ/EryC1/StrS family aminotransferase [Bacteroidota bacterium]|nr:DegT/DnrJ/EryC1/StrS family aminotransferase [Bacteroidota bacterium]
MSKSCIGAAEKEAVMNVLDNEYLGMGQKVKDFEYLLSEYFGRPSTCVINGTAALHLALQAVGVGLGDEVLVPSITYVSSFQAIAATGATPISCEIDPATFCLDVKDAEARITEKTKAIMPVHYAGGMGSIPGYYELANRYGLRVIEDAAHALGSSYNGKVIGSFGDIICFSFDGIKNITSGEGGCIVTSDPEVVEKVKNARLLGVERDTEARFNQKRSWDISVSAQGWRYHMSDIMAAIGIAQFNKMGDFAEKRQALAQRYNNNVKSISGIKPLIADFKNIVPHIYVIKVDIPFDRELFRECMLAEGIETGIHYSPNHLLQYFITDEPVALPVTELNFPKIVTLPLHPDLSFDDVDRVCALVTTALANS